jgi:tRNA threonylcarbamoyladenosine dehydratase
MMDTVKTREDLFFRNIMMYGKEGFKKLQNSFVAVAGLGGVGSSAAETLVRAGIGRLRIIDCDVIKPTDVNRQLFALSTNLEIKKVEAAKERLLSINPDLNLDCRPAFLHADTMGELITSDLDFVIDAIDSLHPKGELIRHCAAMNIPIISALGASARTDPFQIKLAKLTETTVCPLARALRRHLKSHGIEADLMVIYSTEPPLEIHADFAGEKPESPGSYIRGRQRQALPSLPAIPAIFGLIAANHTILELLKLPKK